MSHLRVRFTLELELETQPGDDPKARVYDAVHAALRGLRVPCAKLEGYTLRSGPAQTEDDVSETLRASVRAA